MREQGHFLLRLAEALGTIRLRERVVLPALADMQHERGEAGSEAGRKWVIARGYWSIFAGSLFYAALQPARYLREDLGQPERPRPEIASPGMAPGCDRGRSVPRDWGIDLAE